MKGDWFIVVAGSVVVLSGILLERYLWAASMSAIMIAAAFRIWLNARRRRG